MSLDLGDLDHLQKAKGNAISDLEHLKRKANDVPANGECWREAQVLIKQGQELLDMLDQEEANLILGSDWDTSYVRIDRDEVQNFEKKQQQATAPSQNMDLFSALESEK